MNTRAFSEFGCEYCSDPKSSSGYQGTRFFKENQADLGNTLAIQICSFKPHEVEYCTIHTLQKS